MRGADQILDYNRVRFTWKKELNASKNLSRSAKHLGTFLCDNYVNKTSGRCWPKNKTISERIQLSVRSIQRHLKELEAGGWLRLVKVHGVRRTYQISFPDVVLNDKVSDSVSPSGMTKTSLERDAAVTPYKNQRNNQRNGTKKTAALKHLLITEGEHLALKQWRNWISNHIEFEVDGLFELLRVRDAFHLPCRFPQGADAESYRDFFAVAISSKGKCFV